MFYSALEQFKLSSFINIHVFMLDFNITNFFATLLIFFLSLSFYCLFSTRTKANKPLYSKQCMYVGEFVFSLVNNIINTNIAKKKKSEKYSFLIFYSFFIIFFCNILGLLPYSYTITSSICVTTFISFTIFISIHAIFVRKLEYKILSLFLPKGISISLGSFLVFLEIISFSFRPISLSVRLFANMTAGHVLLKIIIGFSFVIFSFSPMQILPVLFICVLLLFELCVAIIQAFVFSTLISIYLNEILNIE